MALDENAAKIWSGIDTVTIEEAGFLLYGIEPHIFKNEAETDGADPNFYLMSADKDVADLSEIIERAALAGTIEIAHQVPGDITFFDWEKTHLKKISFLDWCKSIPKYEATATALDLATYKNERKLPEETSAVTDWIAKSIELADAIAIEQGGGATNRLSARSVHQAVAKALGELTDPIYRNKRGNPYGESMVRTQALKGWEFPRKNTN